MGGRETVKKRGEIRCEKSEEKEKREYEKVCREKV